jgi:aspartate/methionine/tyrosine aminotransferase
VLLTEASRLDGIELSLIRRMTQEAPRGAVNLALGELGFPLPDVLRQKAIALLQEGTPVYTPNAGLPELRRAISLLYPGSSPDNVCVCNGAEEAIFVALLTLLEPGDRMAVPDPDYSAYPNIGRIMGADIVRLPYSADLQSVDLALWESKLCEGVKALILSNPGNPAGHVFSGAGILHLLDICVKHQLILIVDEIYLGLYFDAVPVSFWDARHASRLIIIGGLSKSHCMSGWRLGWGLFPQGIISAVVKARQYVSTCSNWLSQKLAEFALSPQGSLAAAGVLDSLKECRAVVKERLSGSGIKFYLPSATPYCLLQVGGDDVAVARELARKGVVTVPGSAFGEMGRSWLRLNYAVPLDKLKQALEVILEELHFH